MCSLDLTDEQRSALKEFRGRLSDELQPKHDDLFLVRWLRARKFNVDNAEKMLRESFKYRARWNIDKLHEWNPPEVMKKYYGCGTTGFDKEGCPVIIIPMGNLDIVGLLHCVNRADYVRTTIRVMEEYLSLAEKQRVLLGRPITKLTVIFDMENFSLRDYTWKPATEVVISLTQMYEQNYPEILKACFVVNAPKVFAIFFAIVKPFLDDYTLKKIQIFSNDPLKWKQSVLELVDPDQIPVHWGGTQTDPDGNPKCETKVCLGGEVPKSYYSVNGEKLKTNLSGGVTTETVRKGDKLKIDIWVAKANSLLKWELQSEHHDIKFGITFKEKSGEETVMIPVHKVNCQLVVEEGALPCPNAGTYVLVFDNSYSYLRSKKIFYAVEIIPPENLKNEVIIFRTDG